MPLGFGESDVTIRRADDEHALTAVSKAKADPRITNLDHCACMERTVLVSKANCLIGARVGT
jgi:hypothetical protein